MATATTTTVVDRILHPPTNEKYDFAFNKFLRKEYRFGLDPNRPACKAFMQGHCPLGNECPDKHIAPPSHYNLVCKHWLRGLCKKGDACEFLHEYNLRRMPECNFYSRDQTCSSGEDCLYQHIDPESKVPPCPHYERGFCPLGPHCCNKHVRRDRICPFYLVGFCPNGASCKDAHPRFPTELKKPEPKVIKTPEQLEQERLEKEEQRRKEEELERERDEKAGITPMDRQQPWNRGRGGGHWQKKKRNHSGRPRKY